MPSLVNRTTGRVIAARARLRRDLGGLLFGLMGRRPETGFALGLRPCDQIHTFFVRGSVDAIFCDNDGRVLAVIADLPPNRIGPRVRGAKIVWEAAGGTLAGQVNLGHIVTIGGGGVGASNAPVTER